MSLEEENKELFSRVKELEEKLKRKTKYGLVWEDKSEDVVLECENKYPILKNIKERSIRNDKNAPVNVLIEGDNYHALQILNYTHKGKVDVIYIDPPYNTGNKDFIYNDSFVDGEDGYRHSKWLSFMERRLKLAKELLKDTGVIFISIDDNEQAQLKLLCDGVFGEGNFVANLIWENKEGGGKSDSNHFRIKHEYTLVYASKIDKLEIFGLPIEDEARYKLSDEYESTRGKYQLIGLDSASLGYVKSLDYPIIAPDGTGIHPNIDNRKISRWRWGKEKLEWGLKNDFVVIKKNQKNNWGVYTKQYINCDNEGNLLSRTIQPIGVISKYSTTQSNRLIKEIFEEVVFTYSKPTELIHYLLKVSSNKNATILDFFAGSGTTGHAVLELNKEDGGNRQFILVTNNGDEKSEHKIAEKITYERLKRVMNGYQNKKGEKVEGLGGNLDYLRCDFIDKILHEDNMRLNIAKNSKDIILFKEGASGVEKEEKIKNESIYTIVTNLHSSTTAIYQSIDDSHLDKFKKDLENISGYKSLYLNPLIGSEDYFKDLKDITIQEMPNIN